jgi:hypothetical protein
LLHSDHISLLDSSLFELKSYGCILVGEGHFYFSMLNIILSEARRPILFRVSWALIIINVSLLQAAKHSMRQHAVAAEQHQLTVSWRRRSITEAFEGGDTRRPNGVEDGGGADMDGKEATASANRKLPPHRRTLPITSIFLNRDGGSPASCGAGGRGTTGLGAAVAASEREAGSVVGGLMVVAGYSQ